MKSTGVVRKLDPLGRVVLPKEIRRIMDIKQGDPIEVFVDDDKIILSKYTPSCMFCNEVENVYLYKGKRICHKCADELISTIQKERYVK